MRIGDHVVYLVDDEAPVREAVSDLLNASGFSCLVFDSAEAYINSVKPEVPGCLILDMSLPGIQGLELQRQLADSEHPPIIFITGHGDVPSSVRAMKAGAVDFLAKPFLESDLLDAVERALAQDRNARAERAERNALEVRYASLTPREREVMALVVSGLLNKQSAAQLGISEVTMQIHRGRVMKKMEADSLSDLVRMAMALAIPIEGSRHPQRNHSRVASPADSWGSHRHGQR